ncbi:AT-hook motif nuclear-localized protein 17-like [Zingiber officinale]|uniref:AT-hook motif nuclear-localized protein 17-like n=1 Tax=Zingiber officinale TaxID=94328 RepID=UPI001C4CAAA0|nr:AT-hook motif nuclear-localized protein 17-like [Zingiber officinale]
MELGIIHRLQDHDDSISTTISLPIHPRAPPGARHISAHSVKHLTGSPLPDGITAISHSVHSSAPASSLFSSFPQLNTPLRAQLYWSPPLKPQRPLQFPCGMKDDRPPFQQRYLHQQQRQSSFCREVATNRSSGVAKRPNPDVESKEKAGDESNIEVAKRLRGRPPGSKNKPKTSVVIEREAEPAAAMRLHVLEIPSGHDVADSLAAFCRSRNLGLCVLSGTGAVSDVALRQPHGGMAAEGAATITFRGRFEILSVSATFLPQAMAVLSPAARGTSISICLAGPRGQVVGGTVTGPMVAAETVALVVAAFANPTFHHLPAEDGESVSAPFSSGGGSHMQEHDQHAYAQRRRQGPAAELTALFMCNSHVPSDGIWPPISRPSQPPPF